MSEDRMADTIRTGIAMEAEGLRAYQEAATRTSHPFAKEMFLSLASDEKRHQEWFEALAAKRGIAPAPLDHLDPDGFLKSIREVFGKLRGQLGAVAVDADDIKAIDAALGLEEESYKLYAEAAKAAADPDEKALLEFVAHEENNHYRILDDTKLYLTDPEKWNIKEENPLIDGG